MNNVKDCLQNLRKILGFNTTDMANSIGVSKSYYEKIEFGQRKASRNFIGKLKTKYPQIDINIFF